MTLGKKIIQPPYLKAGDKVALVSPAYWVPQEALQQAAETIKSWGLLPVIGPNTNNLNVNAYAGTADERAADLLWALEDDSGNGVMCLHGPMAFQIASNQEPATTITRNILFGKLPQYIIPSNPYNRIGHAEGILVGGNLSSFCSVSGTKYNLPARQDIILFIEEVEESLHDIDRLFYMLRLQQNFERVKGIIFGTFNSIKYDLQYGSVEQMLVAHLLEYDIPICCGFPVGSNSCIPLIEGAHCTLDVTDHAVLTYNMKGNVETFEVDIANPKLIKERQL